MEPKIKAHILVDMFYNLLPLQHEVITKSETWKYSNWCNYKTCSLIVVDEILNSAGFIWGSHNNETGLTARDEFRKYWNEVKQEIEKCDMKDNRQEIKICTGCDFLSTDKVSPPHLGCCPDNNYVLVKEYIRLKNKEISELKDRIVNMKGYDGWTTINRSDVPYDV